MKTILSVILFIAGVPTAPSPSPIPPANYYVASLRRISVPACVKLWSDCPTCTAEQRITLRVNYNVKCKHQPELRDVAEDCRRGYHLERQLACYGCHAAEQPPTPRMICHADSDRGIDQPCGVECAWQKTISPTK